MTSALSGYLPQLPPRELPQPAPRAPELQRGYTVPPVRRRHLNRYEQALAARIAAEHDIDVALLFARCRQPYVVRARDHFVAVLRWSTMPSLPDIGALVGLDHTSVMAAIARHEERLNRAQESP